MYFIIVYFQLLAFYFCTKVFEIQNGVKVEIPVVVLQTVQLDKYGTLSLFDIRNAAYNRIGYAEFHLFQDEHTIARKGFCYVMLLKNLNPQRYSGVGTILLKEVFKKAITDFGQLESMFLYASYTSHLFYHSLGFIPSDNLNVRYELVENFNQIMKTLLKEIPASMAICRDEAEWKHFCESVSSNETLTTEQIKNIKFAYNYRNFVQSHESIKLSEALQFLYEQQKTMGIRVNTAFLKGRAMKLSRHVIKLWHNEIKNSSNKPSSL